MRQMTTLFNINQYQQTYKRDWDSATYDSTWDKPDDITEISQDEVSTVVEVLEEEKKEVKSDEISSERWNPAHFGETPRKVDANGNPTIFWDESIEPPDPDDFKSATRIRSSMAEVGKENSNNLIYVAESGQASPSQESSREESNYADCAKLTNFVKKDCGNASPMSQSTTTCATSNSNTEESTSSHHRHHASPLPLKESAWVEQISETAYPQYCDSLTESNPNSSVSKTSPDCYRHPNDPEKNPEHILNRCSGSFESAGTMRNGWLLERDFSLEPDGLAKRLLLVATSGRVVEKFSIEPTPWEHQIRSQSQEARIDRQERSIQPRMVGAGIWTANRVDRPPGVPSGNSITRARRAALGNCLDTRLAAIAWKRVLYLNSLCFS